MPSTRKSLLSLDVLPPVSSTAIDNPREMIHHFCSMFEIKECRKMLWRLTVAFMGSEKSDGLNRMERADYIFFYEMLAALIEVVYTMEEKNKNHKRI